LRGNYLFICQSHLQFEQNKYYDMQIFINYLYFYIIKLRF